MTTFKEGKCGFYRPVWTEISHPNLKHNFSLLSSQLRAGVSLLSVVKANGYGHGLIPVSKTLEKCGSSFFGVSSAEEALQLKKSGIKEAILILGNIYPFDSLPLLIENKIRVTLASIESARICAELAKKMRKKIVVHAKIDTGMNRIGVQVEKGIDFIKKILTFPSLLLEGIYTHFSGSAEDPQFTKKQLELFSDFVKKVRENGCRIPYIHCANSAALLKYPDSHFTMVRPGIALYGVHPVRKKSPQATEVVPVGTAFSNGVNPVKNFPSLPSSLPSPLEGEEPAPYLIRGEVEGKKTGDEFHLKPVLSWKSRIVFLKEVPANTPISYAGTFRTKGKSKIATAAFGYADGYRRNLSNKGQVLVRGKRVPVIGRVTMDMTMLDVTEIPDARVGDEVVLLGEQGAEKISVEEMAEWAETSAYEIFCGIASRVPRVNVR